MTTSPKTLAQMIRERYPNPVRGINFTVPAGHYCVVQAAARFAGETLMFRGLRKLNPNLTLSVVDDYIVAITTANDAGDFDRAWAILDKALQWRGSDDK